MTIEASLYPDRDDYIDRVKVFYPTQIPVGHNQLRQLISSPYKDAVYFASGSTIYRLDTKTKKRVHVQELPFTARCAASDYGWFCAGGKEHGNFAAIRLPDIETRQNGTTEAGSLLTLRNRDAYTMRHECLGEDIVNGITIHQVPRSGHAEGNVETIALVTNNDKILRMYSLDRREVIWKSGEFDCPMNTATISPGGDLMIVVGDCSEAYVYQRKDTPDCWEGKDLPEYPVWDLIRELPLHTPATASLATYFTAAWSYNGRLFATASEHGYLMIMDSSKIKNLDANPIQSIVSSSRPMTTPGAVRALCFTPAPWDYLLWTENYGRVIVADVRTGLRARQAVQLDVGGDRVRRCELIDSNQAINDPAFRDFDREMEYIRAHASGLGDRTINTSSSHASESRVRYFDSGLTEEENQIIGGLRATRRRQNAASSTTAGTTSNPAQRSIERSNANRQRILALAGVGGNIGAATSTDNIANHLLSDPVRTSPYSARMMNRWRDAIDSEQSTNSYASDPWRTIERAIDMTAENPQTHRVEDGRDLADLIPTLSSSPRVSAGRVTLPSFREHLSVLEAERTRRRERMEEDASLTTRGAAVEARRQPDRRSNHHEPSTRGYWSSAASEAFRRVQLRSAADHERALTQLLSLPLTSVQASHAEGIRDGDPADWGVGTTGLAVGKDGRTAYVGTESGIFELKLDFQSRKFWPAMDMR